MTTLRIEEIGDISITIGGRQLTGKVRNVELDADDQYDYIDSAYSFDSVSMHKATTYSFAGEFVIGENGHAYTIKELPKEEPVPDIDFTAETTITVMWDKKQIKKARKRVGAPKGAAYRIDSISEGSDATIKFWWTKTHE